MLPSLRELQRSFATGVLHDDVTTVGGLLVPGDFSGESRLQIYRNNVFTSLTDALEDIYPVVARLVGNEFFSYAAHEYIVRYPSRSGNLHEFGDRLPGFLGGFPPAKDLGYLADVAHLEWTWHEGCPD